MSIQVIESKPFRYWISDHAVERFRERVDEEHRARSDRDLAQLLDERIHRALVAGKSTVVVDGDYPHEDTRVVEIESRTGNKSIVVMRTHRPNGVPRVRCVGGPDAPAPLAITILTPEMASSNFAIGRWRVPNRALSEKLAHVKIPPRAEAIQQTQPTRSAEQKEETMPKKPVSRGSSIERIEYVKKILRERPGIKHAGEDGLSELVRAKFGVGLSWQIGNEIREQLSKEKPATPQVAPVASPKSDSLGEQLSAAIALEKRAKEILARAKEELEAATVQVNRLMDSLREMRE